MISLLRHWHEDQIILRTIIVLQCKDHTYDNSNHDDDAMLLQLCPCTTRTTKSPMNNVEQKTIPAYCGGGGGGGVGGGWVEGNGCTHMRHTKLKTNNQVTREKDIDT